MTDDYSIIYKTNTDFYHYHNYYMILVTRSYSHFIIPIYPKLLHICLFESCFALSKNTLYKTLIPFYYLRRYTCKRGYKPTFRSQR